MSIDTLLTPPTLMAGQESLDEALSQVVESSKTITLVYPTTGDIRTPYVLCNLDDEAGDEAVVFYRLTDTAGVTGAVMITLLDNIDGQWKAVWTSEELSANEVSDVAIIENDGVTMLVVGLTLFTSDNANSQQMVVYQYKNNALYQTMSQECAAHTVFDLDNDGMMDLITIVKNVVGETEEATTTATRYRWRSDSFVETQTLALDPQVTSYTISEGILEDGTPALFVDGIKGTELITELLVLSSGQLVDRLADFETTRPTGLNVIDYDGDGVIELPLTIALPGEDTSIYRVAYYTVTYNGLVIKEETYSDYNSGYYFSWPDDFGYRVKLTRSTDGNTVSFYDYASDELLFVIKVFDYSELDDQSLPGDYIELMRDGQLVYGTMIMDTTSSLQLTEEEIKQAFALF